MRYTPIPFTPYLFWEDASRPDGNVGVFNVTTGTWWTVRDETSEYVEIRALGRRVTPLAMKTRRSVQMHLALHHIGEFDYGSLN